MKALILAAGYATRLYPLTLNTPKPLLEVDGKPIIGHVFDRLSALPITHTFVVTNNRFYDVFTEWKIKNGNQFPFPVTILNDGTMTNEDRLGAIGDIHFVLEQYGVDDDLVVIAGDNLFEADLRKMHNVFHEKKSSVVGLYDLKDPALLANRLGCVTLGPQGQVVNFEEKPAAPQSSLAATACYFFTRRDLGQIVSLVAAKQRCDNSGDFIKHLVGSSRVYGHPLEGQWFDIGSHDQLSDARKFFGNRRGI